eukprot:scaffold7334_cov64-Phaeocystis_antarctica.AAC.11
MLGHDPSGSRGTRLGPVTGSDADVRAATAVQHRVAALQAHVEDHEGRMAAIEHRLQLGQHDAMHRPRCVAKVGGDVGDVLRRPAAAIPRVAACDRYVQEPLVHGGLATVSGAMLLEPLQGFVLVAHERSRVARIDDVPVIHQHPKRVEAAPRAGQLQAVWHIEFARHRARTRVRAVVVRAVVVAHD